MTSQMKYPIPSAEWENIEEALSLIYHRFEEGEKYFETLHQEVENVVGAGVFNKLLEKEYIRQDKNLIALTPEGEGVAIQITRRHRLAERLLTDVLSIESRAVDPNACRMEHILSTEVTNSICTLLGHPSQCPHGSPIPPGDCCRRVEARVEPLVESLEHMSPGDSGTVAYIALRNHPHLHKLLSLGVIPGAPIHLHQTLPSFVIDLGETQLALEAEVAKSIYVRRQAGDASNR